MSYNINSSSGTGNENETHCRYHNNMAHVCYPPEKCGCIKLAIIKTKHLYKVIKIHFCLPPEILFPMSLYFGYKLIQ